jgi:hypothetical protein
MKPGWTMRVAAIVSLLIFAAACWRFWDFFVVTMAMVGVAFSLGTVWVLWAVHREFGRGRPQ